jgi:6-phospho-beta-glucosidase
MKPQRTIVIAGAGSLRTLALVHDASLLARQHGGLRLVLMDTHRERLQAMERLCRLMPEFDPGLITLAATTDFARAVDGADMVQVVIRVDPAAEVRAVAACARHAIHGDDTYGPSAIALGMRTVPVLLKMARVMERRCPQAWLCVFSNPVTMNTDVLNRCTGIKTLGICGGVENFVSDMAHLHYDPETQPIPGLAWRGAGLNHFSWVTRDSTFNGEPIGDFLRRYLPSLDERRMPQWFLWLWNMERRVFEFTGQMPMNNGHCYHYFFWDECVAHIRERHASRPRHRARRRNPWTQRFRLARQAAIPHYWETLLGPNTQWHFDRFDPAIKAMFSMWHDLGWEVGLNVPNRGHVVDLPEGHVVETTCRVTAKGPQPLGIDAVPPMIKGLAQAVSRQQRMVADVMIDPTLKGFTEAVFADPCHRSLGSVRAVTSAIWQDFERHRPRR